jgi:hypothetical protein
VEGPRGLVGYGVAQQLAVDPFWQQVGVPAFVAQLVSFSQRPVLLHIWTSAGFEGEQRRSPICEPTVQSSEPDVVLSDPWHPSISWQPATSAATSRSFRILIVIS